MQKILAPLAACGLMFLAACGGSNALGPTLVPPPPAPAASPPPPPEPTGSAFDTAEFRRNYGLNNINAIPAYEAGASGNGVTVAVIDTGIDVNHSEFVGQIHPDSRDLIASRQIRTIQDENGHGTFVSGIIAARKDDTGVQGVAFNSQILTLRADIDGSCNADDGCRFRDNDLAAGIDQAIASGAKIINFSLGGDPPNQALHDAFFRAFDAGIVFVIAAGNDHTADPDPFAQFAIHDGAEGRILVVGAIGPDNEGSSFSAHAGNSQDYFVVAPGVDVTSTFIGDLLAVGSGTSFAAPHVTGAAALLFEMFPALTGIEVFEILLDTAVDLGEAGVDDEFGHGLIDLGAAVQPLGVLSLAVANSVSTLLGSSGIDASGAFGDGFGLTGALGGVMMLDGYRRSYLIDLSARLRSRATEGFDIYGALERKRTYEALSLSPTRGSILSLAFYDRHQRQRELADALPMAQRALTPLERPSAYFTGSLGENTTFSTAYGISPVTLLEQQEGGENVARGFISSGFAPDLAFTPAGAQSSMALSHSLKGGTRLSFAFSLARYERPNDFLFGAYSPEARAVTATARASRSFGPIDLMLQLSAVNEKNAVLGTLSSGALTLGDGAGSLFTGIGARAALPAGMALTVSFNQGYTRVSGATGSFIDGISNFRSMSFAAAITRDGVFAAGDRIGLAVSQPLRIENGAIGLTLPTGRDYIADEILFTSTGAGLAPSGREIDLEMSYRWRGLGGTLIEANVMRQFNAGHSRFAGGRTTVLVRARRPF